MLDELLYELVECEQHVAVGAQQGAAAVLKAAAVHVAIQHTPQHLSELAVQPSSLLSTSSGLLQDAKRTTCAGQAASVLADPGAGHMHASHKLQVTEEPCRPSDAEDPNPKARVD